LNLEFFSSTMNDDRISFKSIVLILISNNFHLWIEELKDWALKIKIWKYIDSYDKIEESRKKILSEMNHFVVKQSDLTFSTAADNLITVQAKNYRTDVKKYKRSEKQIVKIIQRMLKIDETIRKSARFYISSKLIFVFVREILQLLITRYKKIDDQIKKQIHEKFQALKQSSFKNQIKIWVTNWKNLRSRILSLNIKNFFDSETMFVEKFLTANRKWTFMFCDN
jgi:hypothetical protein